MPVNKEGIELSRSWFQVLTPSDVRRISSTSSIAEKTSPVGWIVGSVFALGSDEDCVSSPDMVLGDCVVSLASSPAEALFGPLSFNRDRRFFSPGRDQLELHIIHIK